MPAYEFCQANRRRKTNESGHKLTDITRGRTKMESTAAPVLAGGDDAFLMGKSGKTRLCARTNMCVQSAAVKWKQGSSRVVVLIIQSRMIGWRARLKNRSGSGQKYAIKIISGLPPIAARAAATSNSTPPEVDRQNGVGSKQPSAAIQRYARYHRCHFAGPVVFWFFHAPGWRFNSHCPCHRAGDVRSTPAPRQAGLALHLSPALRMRARLFLDRTAYFPQMFPKGVSRIGCSPFQVVGKV